MNTNTAIHILISMTLYKEGVHSELQPGQSVVLYAGTRRGVLYELRPPFFAWRSRGAYGSRSNIELPVGWALWADLYYQSLQGWHDLLDQAFAAIVE